MERPVILNSLAVCDIYFLLHLSDGFARKSRVFYEQRLHQLIASEPGFVLTGTSELRTLQHIESSIYLFLGQFIAKQNHRGSEFFRNSDIVVPPVRVYRLIRKPPPGRLVKQKAKFLRHIERRLGIFI